jgi:Haloacid dehalogenase-like hydrolase
MNSKRSCVLVWLLFLGFFCHLESGVIVVDLGNVLFQTNMNKVLKYLGKRNLLWYMIATFNTPHAIKGVLKQKLYQIMLAMKKASRAPAMATDDDGIVLPPLMVEWLKGCVTSDYVKWTVLKAISCDKQLFLTSSEKLLIARLVQIIFTPKLLVDTRCVNCSMVDFLKKCKIRGYTLYVLSNWDWESFELLKSKYSELFGLFDGVMISGQEGYIKPEKDIFRLLCDRYELQPSDCWFIDDQKNNVAAAREFGMKGLLYRNNVDPAIIIFR